MFFMLNFTVNHNLDLASILSIHSRNLTIRNLGLAFLQKSGLQRFISNNTDTITPIQIRWISLIIIWTETKERWSYFQI